MVPETSGILLVEDNPNDVQMTQYALQKNNINNPVQIARDGAEALDYLFCRGRYVSRDIADGPRLILLDLKLPRVDGLEVLRRVKSDARTKRIPVVVMTTSPEDRDIRQAYNLGANGYIIKPIDFDQFTDTIRSMASYWLLVNQPSRP